METDVDWHELLQDCWSSYTNRSVSAQATSAVRLVFNAVDRMPDTCARANRGRTATSEPAVRAILGDRCRSRAAGCLLKRFALQHAWVGLPPTQAAPPIDVKHSLGFEPILCRKYSVEIGFTRSWASRCPGGTRERFQITTWLLLKKAARFR
jgi:hypothetical protein